MAFYKKIENEILAAPNFVTGPSYNLTADAYTTYTYPVDGWYWFDTFDLAIRFFAQDTNKISMRQCRLALLSAGLLDDVETAMINASAEANIEWEYANEVYRNSTLLQTFATSLGISDEQLDQLFTLAKTL